MVTENYGNLGQFPTASDSEETLPSAGELSETLNVPEEEVLEDSLEALEAEEQEVADDPVRLYLHEIGKVTLLTAQDEKVLAKKIEMAEHIKSIRLNYLQKWGKNPSEVEIVLTMLREVGQNAAVISLLREQLGLKSTNSFAKSVSDPKLLEGIDGVINQQLSRQ